MHSFILILSIFFYGMCIGSFLNVCIYRIPKGQSIVSPGSRCPNCYTPIKFFDNIPIVSYLLLKGMCRNCKKSISFRYPLIELCTGLIGLVVYHKFGFHIQSIIYFVFLCILLLVSMIDIDHRIIPDIISLPGIPLFFLLSLLIPNMLWYDSIYGILAGGGSLFAVAWIYFFLTGKEGMGGGDVKLLAMIGSLIGLKGVLFTIFISSAIGSVAGLVIMILTKKNLKLAIPFGPFLALGASLYVFFGNDMIDWYFNTLTQFYL
ncbi:MAG: prepilin peptidase [Desulfobacterales bacterium]|nr:prepilin peptidase [Desulfobacterales bacterium]